MKNIIISKKNIFYVLVTKYKELEDNHLIIDETCFNQQRKVIFINNHCLDLETGEEIYQLNREYNFVIGPIYRNTAYISEICKYCPSDKDILQAITIYYNFLEKQELIKRKKLIPFHQERIY